MFTLSMLLYIIFLHTIIILPGYFTVRKISFSDSDSLCLSLMYASGMVWLAAVAVLWYLIPLPSLVPTLLFVMLLVVAVLQRRELWSYGQRVGKLLASFVLVTMLSFLLTTLPYASPYRFFPDPTYQENRNYNVPSVKMLNLARTQANDNWLPFRHAQFFFHRWRINQVPFFPEWGVNYFYRTPLMGALSAGIFLVTQDKIPGEYLWAVPLSASSQIYWRFQALSHIVNMLILLPAFSLAAYLFSRRQAWIVFSLLGASPFFFYNALFSWPKSLVGFLVLLAWSLTLIKHQKIWPAICLAIGYYVHDLTVLYAAGWFAWALLSNWRSPGNHLRIANWSPVLLPLGTFIAMLLPWFITSRFLFHQSSLFYYYPFALHGLPFEPSQAVAEFFRTPLAVIMQTKISSLWYLFWPWEHDYLAVTGSIHYFWVVTQYSISGAIGVSLSFLAYLGLAHYMRRHLPLIMGVMIIPVLFSVVIIGWPKGLGALHFAQASVALATIYSVAVLQKIKWNWLRLIIIAGQVMQFWLVLAVAYDLQVQAWFLSLSGQAIIFITGGAMIYLIYKLTILTSPALATHDHSVT